MKLKDKVAVITGSARGIGRAIAEAMAREGARVVISDRDGDEAAKTAKSIGGAAIAIEADVSRPKDIEVLFEKTEKALGRVDILVNNAGIGSPRLVVDIGLEEWERIIRINLTGALLCSQQAAPAHDCSGDRGQDHQYRVVVWAEGRSGSVGLVEFAEHPSTSTPSRRAQS